MFRFPLFFAIAISSLDIIIGQATNCSEKETCFYISEHLNKFPTQKTAMNDCRRLNDSGRVWYLIQLDSNEKFGILLEKMGHDANRNVFWIGLVRENVTANEEASNLTLWKNGKKWRWVIDGTPLSNETKWSPNEPNNRNWIERNGSTENCVISKDNGHFFDWPCQGGFERELSENYPVLVCESPPIPTEPTTSPSPSVVQTTPKSIAEKTTTETKTTPASSRSTKVKIIGGPSHQPGKGSNTWIWIVIGLVCGVALICVVAAVAIITIRRRREGASERRKMTLRYKPNTNDPTSTAEIKPTPEMSGDFSTSLQIFQKSNRENATEFEFTEGDGYHRLIPKKTMGKAGSKKSTEKGAGKSILMAVKKETAKSGQK